MTKGAEMQEVATPLFCVGLNLLAENTCGTHVGPYYLWQVPTDISPFGANAVAGSGLVVLIMNARCTSATTIREF